MNQRKEWLAYEQQRIKITVFSSTNDLKETIIIGSLPST
jgi:hypothetical protein